MGLGSWDGTAAPVAKANNTHKYREWDIMGKAHQIPTPCM